MLYSFRNRLCGYGALAALLLSVSVRAAEEAARPNTGGYRLVGDSGWRVSDPAGFALQHRDEKAAYLFSWERSWKEAVTRKGVVSIRRHKEHIRLFYDKNFQWSPGDGLPRDCGGHKVLGQSIEGRHYDDPSLSYACEEENKGKSETHVYYVVFEGREDSDEAHAWRRIILKYQHEWDQPAPPPPQEKTPHLQDFRLMQGTLAPVEDDLRTPIESLDQEKETD